MTEGRSRFTNRVMEAVRADDRALAGRRRRVTRGLAAVMLLGGVLFLMQEPRSTTAPGGEGREAWLAVVEDAAPGASGPAVAEAVRELARLYLLEGDEVAGAAVQEASRRGLASGQPGGGVDLFGLLAVAAREDRAAALGRARTMLLMRQADVAALDLDWESLLQNLGSLSDEDLIWCVLFYLESFSPVEAAPYIGWAGQQLGHASEEIRVRALQTLRRLAPAGIDNAIVAMLQSGTARERQVAILVAADLDLAATTAVAIEGVLDDPDPVVRQRAAQALAHFDDPQYAAAVGALVGDADCNVRIHGAWAAARLGDPQYVGLIVPIAQGTVPGDCAAATGDPVKLALSALAALGDGRAADAAEVHLTDFLGGDASKRGLVIPSLLALEELHRTSAIPLVLSLEPLVDTSLWIQAAATLHALGSPTGAFVLNTHFYGPDENYRTQAINAAARLRDEIFREDFEDLQNHESPKTRDAADRAIDVLDQPGSGS